MVPFLFFCSGATALIYEVIWSKYLALMFGSTVQGQTVVLAVFMGGLALGNRLVGSRADLLRQPLAAYGYMEIAIGLFAFFFEHIYNFTDGLFIKLGSPLLERTSALLLLKGFLSTGLLLLPTVLMGGTLPLLAAWLQKGTGDAGRRSARFYAINSLGAVAGSFAAGFFLIQALGLPATVQMTALCNVLIGSIAVIISRRQGNLAPTSKPSDNEPSLDDAARSAFRRGCLLVALTGAISMGLEVLSSRCLALIFGGSLQAFAIVLMAFILGIGLGSSVVASRRLQNWRSETAIVLLLVFASLWIGILLFNIENVIDVYRHLKSGLARSTMGFRLHQLLIACVSLIVLGLPAGMLGSVLPLCIRVVSEKGFNLGDRVGRLLTWNTVGAVIGVLLTGFVLMPSVGLRGSFAILAGVMTLGGLIIACSNKTFRLAAFASVAMILIVIDGLVGGESWRYVLSSGLFRIKEAEVYADAMKERREQVKIHYYKDAADATVSVEEKNQVLSLRINGKVDASSHGDLATQCLLSHLPLLCRPDSKEVFIVGLGSGISAGAALLHPGVEHITVAENCQPVIEAAHWFTPWNNGVLTNSRVRICPEDARTVLKLSPQKYDVIINQPSNPWMAGVGSVFSREFYQLAAGKLEEGGVMVQWFHLYEMSDAVVFMVIRTFGSVFPHVELWDSGNGDILLIGSLDAFDSTPETAALILSHEPVRRQLAQVGLRTPGAILAKQVASRRTAAAIPGPGPIQTDTFPVLEYEAPRSFYIGEHSSELFNYDERTWQKHLASPAKRNLLAALSEQELLMIFAEFGSMNSDLLRALRSRVRHRDPNALLDLSDRFLPSIFTQTNGVRPIISNGTELEPRLIQAEDLLSSDRPLDGILAIEQVLGALPNNPAFKNGGYLAAEGIKRALQLGELGHAQILLQIGFRLSPDLKQLQFLDRYLAQANPSRATTEDRR
jgi:spermidine synthase